MATTAVDVHVFEILIDEAVEAYEEMIALRKKLMQLKQDSEAYLDVLPDVAVCASVITAKTEALILEIDAIEDSFPDDD
jgi:hypothetical protein